jgi:rhodanese-related sulfurtransferase
MLRARSWLEMGSFLALALFCALASNALAGPTRRLPWVERKQATPASVSASVPASVPALAPASVPASASVSLPAPTPTTIPKPVPSPAPAVRPAPPGPAADLLARFPPLANAPQADISGDEAVWLQARGALFIDARRSATYALGHIPGARSLPAWEDGLVAKVEQLGLFTPDLKAPVVIYCAGGDCHDSHLVAEKLWLAGFRNLRIYADGFPDWEKRGGGVAKGEGP